MRPGCDSTRTSNRAGRRAQRGVAAIEFALSVVLLLVIVFGIVSYGAMFCAQQKLSHLAGEGARYALVLSMEGTGGGGAQLPCSYITTLAEHDALLHKAPDCSIPCTPSDCPWNTGAPTEPTHPAAQYATITLDYSVQDLPRSEEHTSELQSLMRN